MNRTKTMQYLNYKYHIGVGQIDIKLSIESFFTKGRTNKMVMSHKQIVVMDEPESTTLAQEYENLPDLTEEYNNEDEPSPAENVPPQGSGTDDLSAKRQKRIDDAPQVVTAQSLPPAYMLNEAGFTALNQSGSSSSLSTGKEPLEGYCGPYTPTGSREHLTGRARYNAASASRTSSPQLNQPENTSVSRVLQVRPPSLVSSFFQRIVLI
jgi:hypothetical protein